MDLLFITLSFPTRTGPHHEAPETVNALVSEWIAELEEVQQEEDGVEGGTGSSKRRQAEEEKGRVRVFREPITGREVRAGVQDGRPRDWVEWLVASTILR